MRGLYKATGYYQTLEAREDWERIAQQAIDAGSPELVEKFRPKDGWGWRRIDRCIAKLRSALLESEKDAPTAPDPAD